MASQLVKRNSHRRHRQLEKGGQSRSEPRVVAYHRGREPREFAYQYELFQTKSTRTPSREMYMSCKWSSSFFLPSNSSLTFRHSHAHLDGGMTTPTRSPPLESKGSNPIRPSGGQSTMSEPPKTMLKKIWQLWCRCRNTAEAQAVLHVQLSGDTKPARVQLGKLSCQPSMSHHPKAAGNLMQSLSNVRPVQTRPQGLVVDEGRRPRCDENPDGRRGDKMEVDAMRVGFLRDLVEEMAVVCPAWGGVGGDGGELEYDPANACGYVRYCFPLLPLVSFRLPPFAASP